MQRTWKGSKVRTEGPVMFHTLYFIIQIIIAACNSVYEMNQKYIFKNKGNETFWKAEAVTIRTDELWQSGGIDKDEVMPHGFPNEFQTNEWTFLQFA